MTESDLTALLGALGERARARSTAHLQEEEAARTLERAGKAASAADAGYRQARAAALAAVDELYPDLAAEARTGAQAPAPDGACCADRAAALAAPQALLGLDPETVDLVERLVEQGGPAAWPLVRRLLRRLLS